MRERTLVIGLDGVSHGLIRDMANDGTMPVFRELIGQSSFCPMSSSIPEVSSVAWSSVITGKNPGEHGIYGFTDLMPGTYRLRFPGFSELKSPPFWEVFDRKALIINIPSTYPVRPMNGVHLSGFVSVEFAKAVWPASLIPKLREFGYRLDVDASKARISMDLFLKDLEETHQAFTTTVRYLYKEYPWEIGAVVFTGTDRLMHFLWEAYERKDHPFHAAFIAHFREIDAVVGELLEDLRPGDRVVALSDHGFGHLRYHCNLNVFLREEGFLVLDEGAPAGPSLRIGTGTKAFAMDPGRIYLNREGKYPNGSVSSAAYETTREELAVFFRNLRHEGVPVIRDVFRPEDIYRGPLVPDAPDLVLVGADGFDLKATFQAGERFSRDIFTGRHTLDDAFLLLRDPEGLTIPARPSVCDVFSLIAGTDAGGKDSENRLKVEG